MGGQNGTFSALLASVLISRAAKIIDNRSDQNLVKFPALVFTARRSYASAVLGVAILSVCLSVTHMLCDKTKQGTIF